MKSVNLIFCFLIISITSYGQLIVNSANTADEVESIVQSLEGEGVEISNITINAPPFPGLDRSPIGDFVDQFGLLAVDQGLIMTSGAAVNAIGPNDNASIGQFNGPSFPDPDLQSLVPGFPIFDVVTIEFDIVATFDELSFNYVFGSDEYLEFVGTEFNDVFGFFISGPGIDGNRNLAVVPESNSPVAVNTINDVINSQFYVNNGDGSTPFSDFYTQYDGYTTRLTARTGIIPCETYRIKLAIADVSDGIFDSGVFIEEGSFTSTNQPEVEVIYEHEEFDHAAEGCNRGFFRFFRNLIMQENISEPGVFNFNIVGTAENGVDYAAIPDSVIIPPNQDFVDLEIDPIFDGVEEGNETVIIQLFTRCLDNPIILEREIEIRDFAGFEIPPVDICEGDTVTLNEPDSLDLNDFAFTWQASPFLSCTSCPSPDAFPPVTTTFPVDFTHFPSGCVSATEAIVQVKEVVASFIPNTSDLSISPDIFFTNTSQGATDYQWVFGDGDSSTEFSPMHTYDLLNVPQAQEFLVQLTAIDSVLGCTDVVDTLLVVEPLFIPNIITPNEDGDNDFWEVKGIQTDIWSVRIINRWGAVVYEDNTYRNNWDASGLEDGTYYFELVNPPENRRFTGWVVVLR